MSCIMGIPQILVAFIIFFLVLAYAHDMEEDLLSEQQIFTKSHEVAKSVFSGITTFAKLPWIECLGRERNTTFDIAIIGAPFDTGTSYRPGARFGPSGIRDGSRRLPLCGGYNVPLQINPFSSGLKVVDCGDINVTPYDIKHALNQIEQGHKSLLSRMAFSPLGYDNYSGETLIPISYDGFNHPRIIALGGDHTIVLPILRSIHSVYGKVSIIHFDSHLDTWNPDQIKGKTSEVNGINHGTYFYWASKEGLIANGTSVHGALRSSINAPSDYDDDDAIGFVRIEAREIDEIGPNGIVKKIRDTVKDTAVYLSIDIDALDPAYAPATGTPETGGWTTREFRSILRGLEGLKIVSADLVEVAPAYDTNAEITTIAAADLIFEILSIMAKSPLGRVA